MERFCRWVDRLSNVTGTVGAWLIVPLILAMCYEVFARYLFHAPTIWAYELAYLLTGSGWLLGMSYALRAGLHIRVDVVFARLSPRMQAVIECAAFLFLLLPFLTWLTWALEARFLAAVKSGERSGQSAWNPQIWPFYGVFFLSVLFLALQTLAEILRHIRVIVRGVPEVSR
jgi:TRAP-type mannitol/chloroaromatic compound transport system permease small subunit